MLYNQRVTSTHVTKETVVIQNYVRFLAQKKIYSKSREIKIQDLDFNYWSLSPAFWQYFMLLSNSSYISTMNMKLASENLPAAWPLS